MTVVSIHSPSLHHSSSRSALGERKQMRYGRGLSDQGPRAAGGGAQHNPPADGYFAAGYRSVHRFGGNEPPHCSRIDSGYCSDGGKRCGSPTTTTPTKATPCRCGNAVNVGPKGSGVDPYRIKVVSSPLAIETDPSTLNKMHSQSAPDFSSPLSSTTRLQTVSERELSQHKLHPRFLLKYRVTAELGQGATGFVVAARRIEDGRQVAVKFMYKIRIPVTHWLRDRQLGGTVPLEIYILRRIKHEHIVEFLDCFEDERFFYVVMDGSSFTDPTITSPAATIATSPGGLLLNTSTANTTLRQHTTSPIYRLVNLNQPSPPHKTRTPRRHSRDLFETIHQNPTLPEPSIHHIFTQICHAVQYLHAHNIVHRDIKDENIVVTDPVSLSVKLIDFGNAAYVPEREQEWFESFHGTLYCAAPEIVRGERYRGPEQDVWSLGVLLFTLGFGGRPFGDAREVEAGRWRGRANGEGRSEALMEVLDMCLTVDVAKRATIEEVLKSRWVSEGPSGCDRVEVQSHREVEVAEGVQLVE